MSADRVILIVIDACGVGELPDADSYGDSGAATLPHVAEAAGSLSMPHSARLGLGNIVPIKGVPASDAPEACYGKMAEKSAGKDSTTGHWEIGGVISTEPFPVFPDGFPPNLVAKFEKQAKVKTIGNVTTSGTDIIEQLGPHHLETGEIILYTSADSVFQLAAHEAVCPLGQLHEICQIARKMLTGPFAVARVIARPFVGQPWAFTRTSGRKDFSLLPPSETIADLLLRRGHPTMAIGKILDLFAERGFSSHVKTIDNDAVMKAVIENSKTDTDHKLLFANCVDFDMLWGHRNDEIGFARGLEEFDSHLGEMITQLRDTDLLIITADHGCDPTQKHSTDHTREYVPLLAYGRNFKNGVDLGVRHSFADVACTIADVFDLKHDFPGSSFLKDISET